MDQQTRKLQPYLQGLSAEGVVYSPDGVWIAYTAYPEGTLWRSHPDGRFISAVTQDNRSLRLFNLQTRQ